MTRRCLPSLLVILAACTASSADDGTTGATGEATADESAPSDATAPTADDSSSTPTGDDGITDGTDDTDADSTDGTDTDPTGEPGCGDAPCPACVEGAVDAMCTCGDTVVTQGFCCDALAFDAAYEQLTGGCPAGPWYLVDGDHPAASDDNPGTADEPWATIEHATQVATAGDVVIIDAATYTVIPTNSRLDPALNPANSGTPGAPIVFKGRGGPVVTTTPSLEGSLVSASSNTIVLGPEADTTDEIYEGWFVRVTSGAAMDEPRRIASYDGASRTATFVQPLPMVPDGGEGYTLTIPGPILGTSTRDHIVWDGMVVIERDSYHPDTGPVVLWDSDDGALIGCEIVAQPTLLQDNHNAVRVNSSTRQLVRNNLLRGVQPFDLGENNPQNHAAIMIYVSSDCTFEHNEITDSYVGFFPKGESGPHTFRYNHVHGVEKGVRLSYHADVEVSHNLFNDCGMAVQPAEEIAGIDVFNNVFFRCDSGVNNWFAIDGIRVFNNLFIDVAHGFDFESDIGTLVSDHNVFASVDEFWVGGGDVGGFVGWQQMGYDASSVAGDPGVVDAEALDFHPVAGSLLEGAGVDWSDRDGDGDVDEAVAAGLYVDGNERIGRVK